MVFDFLTVLRDTVRDSCVTSQQYPSKVDHSYLDSKQKGHTGMLMDWRSVKLNCVNAVNAQFVNV